MQDYVKQPYKLEDVESHDILIPVHVLANEIFLKNLRSVCVNDGTGKIREKKFSKKHKEWILAMAKSDQ